MNQEPVAVKVSIMPDGNIRTEVDFALAKRPELLGQMLAGVVQVAAKALCTENKLGVVHQEQTEAQIFEKVFDFLSRGDRFKKNTLYRREG